MAWDGVTSDFSLNLVTSSQGRTVPESYSGSVRSQLGFQSPHLPFAMLPLSLCTFKHVVMCTETSGSSLQELWAEFSWALMSLPGVQSAEHLLLYWGMETEHSSPLNCHTLYFCFIICSFALILLLCIAFYAIKWSCTIFFNGCITFHYINAK